MTENFTEPCPSRRAHGRLVATMLVVALAALGCAATDPATGGFRQVQSTDGTPGHLARGAGGSPFDTSRPTIRRLDPGLLAAVQDAARDAQDDGVTLVVNSGWRSRAHQQRLYDEAVAEYGSEEEARRYVSTPDTSRHVTGDAVDLGPAEGDEWLGEHGADYGLCQVFANEIWHYELATTPGGQCPEMLPDSSSRK